MNSLTMLRPSRTLTLLIALGLATPCHRPMTRRATTVRTAASGLA